MKKLLLTVGITASLIAGTIYGVSKASVKSHTASFTRDTLLPPIANGSAIYYANYMSQAGYAIYQRDSLAGIDSCGSTKDTISKPQAGQTIAYNDNYQARLIYQQYLATFNRCSGGGSNNSQYFLMYKGTTDTSISTFSKNVNAYIRHNFDVLTGSKHEIDAIHADSVNGTQINAKTDAIGPIQAMFGVLSGSEYGFKFCAGGCNSLITGQTKGIINIEVTGASGISVGTLSLIAHGEDGNIQLTANDGGTAGVFMTGNTISSTTINEVHTYTIYANNTAAKTAGLSVGAAYLKINAGDTVVTVVH